MKAINRYRGGAIEDVAKLVLRVTVGVVIAWHGWQKMDGGVSNFADFVAFVDVPLPTLTAYVVTTLEFVGGIMIVLGALTRLPAALLALEMIGTGFYVKAISLDTGFIAPEGTGFELDVMLLGCAAAITILGPGRYSVDRFLGVEQFEEEEIEPLVHTRTAPVTVDVTEQKVASKEKVR